MSRASQTNLNRKQAEKQIIAGAFLVCFIIVSLLYGAFILTHANHEHDHNGAGGTCIACIQIQNAESVLKQLGMAAAGGFIVFTGLFAAVATVRAICSDISALSLITAKARMNN